MSRRRAVLTAVGVLGLAVAGVVVTLNLLDAAPVRAERCTAVSNGTRSDLTPSQADNAALIAAIAVRRDLPARAATVGIATALQESKLANVTHGDRDSIGLFQQRPSQGWGTPAQLGDPVYATNAFYDVLIRIAGYQGLPITDAAQKVQRSGFPGAYAQHEAAARAWASALTGNSPASLTCTLHTAAAGSPAAVTARVMRDYGKLPITAAANGTLTVDAGALRGGNAAQATLLAWSLAQWAVAVANDLHLDSVATAGQTWTRSGATWAPSDHVPTGTVRLTLAQ